MTLLFTIVLHNVAVAMLLALLVWGVTRVWKNPPVAHLLWLLVLVKLVTPPLVNLDVWNGESGHFAGGTKRPADFSVGAPQPSVEGSPIPIHVSPDISEAFDESHPTGDTLQNTASREAAVRDQPRATAMAAWNAVRPLLIGIWLSGAGLVALFTGIRIVQFHRLLAGTLPASQRLQSVVKELAAKMGLRQVPDVRVVDSAVAPLVWSVGRRATVVLPRGLLAALDEHQTALVLAHELAHLRRYDHWVRVVELIVSILYWWNPLVGWVRRQLHAVEEQCCDAWVSWVYPDRRHDYAQTLLTAAELLTTHTKPLVLASPFLSVQTLKERIVVVLKGCSQRTTSRWGAVWLTLFALMVIPAGVLTIRAEGRALTGDGQDEKPSDGTAKPSTAIPKTALTDEPIPKVQQPVGAAKGVATTTEPVPAQTADPAKPGAVHRSPFDGVFKFDEFQSEKWPAKPDKFTTWKWTIQGQEITWTRPNQEAIRLSFTIDSSKSLPEIDLTFLDGPDKGEKCRGIYLASRHEIDICFQDPGSKVDRPTNTGSQPGSRHTSIRLVPTRLLTVAEETAVLQGHWKMEIYYSDWWPYPFRSPPPRWSTWRWTVKGNEITWTGMKSGDVKVSFALDPSKSPRQIDLTLVDGPHKGQKLLGIYQFTPGNSCNICFADPGSKLERPTEFSYGTNNGQTWLQINSIPAEKPIVEVSSAATKVEDRGAELDAAITRLRSLGAFVREFHPRGDPRYWVQIISTGSGEATRQSAENFDDDAMNDAEIIGRGTTLHLHLRHTSVTSAGLLRLASAGRIEMLELNGPNVTYGMLKVLPKLPLQGHLGLSSDQLTSAAIKHVTECQQLTGISLEGSLLGNACLEYLTRLPKLQTVSLGKQFTREAFATLGRLENLTSLDVSNLVPDLSDLKQVPKLRRLSLSGKSYGDEAALTIAETFPALEEAYLRLTAITNVGVQHLSRLEKLRILTLDDSLIDDGVADSIRKMKQLKWLSVGNCAIGDDTIAAVSECPEMWYLFLVSTPVTDAGIAHLATFKKPLNLYLAHCKSVTDASIESLAKLPDSQNLHLELTGSRITEEGVKHLKTALPHAQISWTKQDSR